jgi:hypothetical protein
MPDSGSSSNDLAGNIDSSANIADQLADEIRNAGWFDRTDIHDPQRFLEYKREKIDKDYEGLRGALGSVYSAIGIQPSYQSEMDQLSDAELYAAAGDTRYTADAAGDDAGDRLRQLQAGLDAAIASAGKTEFQQRMDQINRLYSDTLQKANQIENDRTAWSQGFHSQAEANQFAENLKKSAGAIHDQQLNQLEREKLIQQGNDQTQLGILNREAAGDVTGAARMQLEMRLDDDEDAIDPNDKQRLARFGEIRKQTFANFDADVARQKKLDDEHFDDQMAQFKEQSKEAKLRAAGKSDEADAAHLEFETTEQAKWYREQADAEVDPEKKKRLLALAQAAEASGKDQRDALQQEQKRHNAQSPALGSDSHGCPTLDDALVTKLTDATKKLDDAVAKLDRALSGPNKPLTSVKD